MIERLIIWNSCNKLY